MTRLWLLFRDNFITPPCFFVGKTAELQAATLTFLEVLQVTHCTGFLLEIMQNPTLDFCIGSEKI